MAFVVYSSKRRKKIFWKAFAIATKTTVIVQIEFIYRQFELEIKLLNQIVQVAEDTKPLVSLLLCQGANQFFIIKVKIIIMKEKDKSETVLEKLISADDVRKKEN